MNLRLAKGFGRRAMQEQSGELIETQAASRGFDRTEEIWR